MVVLRMRHRSLQKESLMEIGLIFNDLNITEIHLVVVFMDMGADFGVMVKICNHFDLKFVLNVFSHCVVQSLFCTVMYSCSVVQLKML